MRQSFRPASIFASVALAASLSPFAAWGVTLTVGPGRMYATPSAASAAAHDGDVIEIAAGTYRDITIWRAQNLTIRGVGGIAHLDAAGLTIPNGKAIWVIQGRGYTIERIEFSGARVPDRNGAGIRQEAAGLTVRDCYFHDNENGILTGADTTSDIVIETTEFARNGAGDGYSHNMYIGNVRSFTLRGCYTHDASVGHLVKSRAQTNYLLYNRITGEAGTSSYEVDLPNGGLAVLVGNVIEQGTATQNPFMVTFAEEGASNPTQRFYMVNNTLVNNRAGGTYVRLSGTPTAAITNNLYLGAGTQLTGAATSSHNLTAMSAWFVDAARFDLHLTATAGAIDMGVDPGAMPAGSTEALLPASQYAHPHGLVARAIAGAALDVGAFEFASSSTPDAGTADVPRDVIADVVTDVPRDVSADVVVGDVPRDVSADVSADVPRDAGADVSADVSRDVSADVTSDGASDPPQGDAGDASTEFVPDAMARDAVFVDAIDDAASDAPVVVDAAVDASAPPDAAVDGGAAGGAAGASDTGCGCAAAGASGRANSAVILGLAALAAGARRRRARRVRR
ncbi:MAG: right-handed parallel beta-helix repeat-containing protein [Polyangiales bacterium]